MKTRNRKQKTVETHVTAKANGSSIIFGVLPVLEALRSKKNRRIEKIFFARGRKEQRISEINRLAKEYSIPVHNIRNDEISRLVKGDVSHQGVIAFAASPTYYESGRLIEEIAEKAESLSVILDGVEDPRNLGAILRTVECTGVDGVFIPDRRAAGLTETVAKTSAGASEYVKVAKVKNINRLIDEFKERNLWVVGATGDAEMDYTDWDWSQSTILVLGSEGNGLHRLTAEKCDVLVKIPMYGRIESLNVSVAAGVILFEAVRQRKRD